MSSPDARLKRARWGRSPTCCRRSGAPEAVVWATSILLAAVGCRTTVPVEVPPASSLQGRTTYEAVLEPGSAAAKLAAQREYIPAAPAGDNQPPVYPEELLNLGLPPQKIVLRLFLDERGRISGIRPSDVASDVHEKHRDAFEASIRSAVETWRFSPAMRRVFVDSPDDGSGLPPYRVLKSETPTQTYFDIRFTFEVRDGRGVVSEGR